MQLGILVEKQSLTFPKPLDCFPTSALCQKPILSVPLHDMLMVYWSTLCRFQMQEAFNSFVEHCLTFHLLARLDIGVICSVVLSDIFSTVRLRTASRLLPGLLHTSTSLIAPCRQELLLLKFDLLYIWYYVHVSVQLHLTSLWVILKIHVWKTFKIVNIVESLETGLGGLVVSVLSELGQCRLSRWTLYEKPILAIAYALNTLQAENATHSL